MAAQSAKLPRARAARSEEMDATAATAAYIHLLRAYANSKDLQSGILIHDRIVSRGLDRDPTIADHLVHMYVKCGSFETAESVFQRTPDPGILSWNRIIAGHAQRREWDEAIATFRRMLLQGVAPGRITYVAALGACCGSRFLPVGKQIHSQIVAAGWDSSLIVSTALIDMYAACGSLRGAVRVFQGMKKRDVVAWTAMVAAYALYGHLEEAIFTYRGMLLEGFLPVVVTFLVLLNALDDHRDWDRGRWIHRQVTEMKLESELSVAAALITMFGKCGDLKKARRVFRRIHQPGLEVYNALLAAHTENGEFWNALLLFRRMQEDGVAPDRRAVLAALGACIRPADLEHGKEIHVSVINHDLERDVDVANALVYMYSKCGSLRDAEWMFQRMERPSLVSWRTLLVAYVKHGRSDEALSSFRKMLLEGISPGRSACVSALRACGSLELPGQGRAIHLIVREQGLESHNRVINAVVEMYGKCKCLEDARRVFETIEQRNPSSWNSLVAACLDCDHMEEALGQFRRMQLEGVKVHRKNHALLVSAIAACSSLSDLDGIRGCAVEMGADSSSAVGNALLAAYCRLSGELEDAERVLAKMDHNRDKEAWSSVFALCGGKSGITNRIERSSKVGRLFRQMLLDGIKPDKNTFTLVLNACMEALETQGPPVPTDNVALIHSCIAECELETDATIAAFLLSTYGRCRALDEACAIFGKSHHLGVAVWNAMIAAFAENGVPENGFLLFQRMAREGVMPNRSTFVEVLNAIAWVGPSGLEQGKIVHSEAVQLGVELDPTIATALMNMYDGCLRGANG